MTRRESHRDEPSLSPHEELLYEIYAGGVAGNEGEEGLDEARVVGRFLRARRREVGSSPARGAPALRRRRARGVAGTLLSAAASAAVVFVALEARDAQGPAPIARSETPVPGVASARSRAHGREVYDPKLDRSEIADSEIVRSEIVSSEIRQAEIAEAEVVDIAALDRAVAHLRFDDAVGSADSARIYLRSVGGGDPEVARGAAGEDPEVGLYIDGVYLPRAQGTLISLADIESVEVLRGPQATLYGKNTVGGVINVITRRDSAPFSSIVSESRIEPCADSSDSSSEVRSRPSFSACLAETVAPEVASRPEVGSILLSPPDLTAPPPTDRARSLADLSPIALPEPSPSLLEALQAASANDITKIVGPLRGEIVDPCSEIESLGAGVESDGPESPAAPNRGCVDPRNGF